MPRDRHRYDQRSRQLRARPFVAIDTRVAENSTQQVYAEVAPVRVRNYDVGLAGGRHYLMLGARKRTIVAQVL